MKKWKIYLPNGLQTVVEAAWIALTDGGCIEFFDKDANTVAVAPKGSMAYL